MVIWHKYLILLSHAERSRSIDPSMEFILTKEGLRGTVESIVFVAQNDIKEIV